MNARQARRRSICGFLVAAVLMVAGGMTPARAGDARFTIPYGPDLRHRVDVFMPSPPKPGQRRKAVVFFHGGGWSTGSRVLNRPVGRALSEMGYVAVLADYRLFPFVRFPAFVHDGGRVVAWLRGNAARFGVAPDRIYLMGHSAGAHIAMLLALDPSYLRAAGVPRRAIRGVIGLAGPYTGNHARIPATRPIFAGLSDPQLARPITFAGNVGPRMLLLHGGADLLVPPRQARVMGRAYHAAGGDAVVRVYPGANHLQVVLAFAKPLRWQTPVFKDVRKFIGAP